MFGVNPLRVHTKQLKVGRSLHVFANEDCMVDREHWKIKDRHDKSRARHWITNRRNASIHVNPERVDVHFDVSDGKYRRFAASYVIIKGQYEGVLVKYSRILYLICSWNI